VKIKEWISTDEQMCRLGNHQWSVARLFELSKGLEVFTMPVAGLYMAQKYPDLSVRDMVMHMNAVNNANLDYPIILDEDGEIMDGMHRVMKAMLTGQETIKAVRFETNPSPCIINSDGQ
jgi:hypothetical protein